MKKIISLVICLTLGVIMLSSVLMPVIFDVEDDQRTIINNTASGKFSNFYGSNLDTLTAEIVLDDYTDLDFDVTVNGESYTVSATVRESMVMCDKLFLRADPRNGGIDIGYASMESSNSTIKDAVLPLVVRIDGRTINVTDSGTINVTETGINWVFIPDSKGDYELVATDSPTPIYLNDAGQVFISTYISTNNLGWLSGNGSDLTFLKSGVKSNLVLTDFVRDDRFVDVVSGLATNVDVNPDAGTNQDGSSFTPFFVMIPRYIDAHTPNNEGVLSTLGTVPLMFIVALIAIAAVAISRSRD